MVTSNISPDSTSIDLPASERVTTARANALHDGSLVRRFNQDGDEWAFLEIVNRYKAKIYSIAFSSLRNRSDAEEVAQDTFIRAHRGLSTFRGECSLATWMHRIALNLSRNRYWYYFRRQRHMTQSLDFDPTGTGTTTLANHVPSTEPGPIGDAVISEYADLFEKCMSRLTTAQSSILRRRSVDNDSYGSISAALGINIGTVKSRIARARTRLRAELALVCPELATDSGQWFAPDRSSNRFSVL